MSYKVKSICLPFSLLCIHLLFCPAAFSQKKVVAVDHRFDAVDQLLKQNQKELGGNFAVVVWQDGKILYQHQGSEDFSPKSPAAIAGAADWMTAALVMTFVDEGKLSLDDKVTKYIPMFGKYMKGYITVRNCLTSTLGIKVDQGIKKALEKVKYETLEDAVNAIASKRDIGTNPGTEFFYSSLGFDIAARVCEVVGKKPYERLMSERIARPLKMRGTTFDNQNGGAPDPTGGAMSSANDYIAFLAMLLDSGMVGDKRVLSEKSVEELESPQFTNLPVKYIPKDLQGAKIGLGNYILSPNGSGTVWASPSLQGCFPYIDKCRHYAAILLVQKPEEDKKPIGQNMMNLINAQLGSGCN
jgi:CubicO group peptidase (beta-lactamase class C family)